MLLHNGQTFTGTVGDMSVLQIYLSCVLLYIHLQLQCHKQELQKAVAEIRNWKTSCEHLGVHKALLNELDNIIDTAGTLKKSRCLEAYLNMSNACIYCT